MIGNEPIYIDHGATSYPKAPGVSNAMARFVDDSAGNPGRGGHRLTVAASRAIETARGQITRVLGSDPERTLLGPSATFWLNTVLTDWLQPGDRVVTSALEHNSVMRPLRALEGPLELDLVVAQGADEDGVPSTNEVARLVADGPTRLVVLSHAANVSGAILPVVDIAAAVSPVPVVVDGAQTAGSVPIDFASMGVAAFCCSGHKGLLGPPGTGVLLLANDVEVEPLVRGGTGSRSESEVMPDHLPDRLEAGTPNGPGIVGLGAACAWLVDRGVGDIQAHEQRLTLRLVTGLRSIERVHLHGWRDGAPHIGIVSFTVDHCDTGELASWLDRERGLMLRAGLHCAPAAHRRLGTFPHGTVRAGIGPFNDDADIDSLISAIRDAVTCGLG